MNRAQTTVSACPQCGQQNRLIEEIGLGIYNCGKCSSEITNPFRYVIFDCETTGLPSRHSDPHMVQLAWSVNKACGDNIEEYCHIIKPDGFSIPREAADIHGITDEKARTHGVPLKNVINDFLRSAVSPHTRLVAHNMDFDFRTLKAELKRLGIRSPVLEQPQFCTMKSTTQICKLPGSRGDYKWPSLEELHTHCFGKSFSGGHDALEDVRATAACFFSLMAKRLIQFG